MSGRGAALVALSLATAACNPAPVEVVRAPAAGSGAAAPAALAVEPAGFDFGRVLAGRRVQKRFSLRNLGRETLALEVMSDCGCIIAGEYARQLPPGASTALTVVLETPRQPGPVRRTVIVRTSNPDGSVPVPIRATVVPAGT